MLLGEVKGECMSLDGLLVDFVIDVRPYNGAGKQEVVQYISAKPENMQYWLCMSEEAHYLCAKKPGVFSLKKRREQYAKRQEEYNAAIAQYAIKEKVDDKGRYRPGMIFGIEQRLQSLEFLRQHNKSFDDFKYLLDEAGVYLKTYHKDIFNALKKCKQKK
jgi:hypothetical protein